MLKTNTFMTGLHLAGVRHLPDLTIPLAEEQCHSLLLTGDNGCGKTSVLMALKSFLEYVVLPEFQTEDSCLRHTRHLRNILSGGSASPVPVAAHSHTTDPSAANKQANKAGAAAGSFETPELPSDVRQHYQKQLTAWESHLDFWQQGAIAAFTSYQELRAKYARGEYILACYGADRGFNGEMPLSITRMDLKPVWSINEQPGRLFLKHLSSLKATEAFTLTQGKKERAQKITAWFQGLEQILRDIYHDQSLTLKFNSDTYVFNICQPGRKGVDFNHMSRGHAALFTIIADLMMRMEAHKRYDLEGLVLIDEIEAHLSPALQEQALPLLTELFPKIQFVGTTCSPLVIKSAPNFIIYDLDRLALTPSAARTPGSQTKVASQNSTTKESRQDTPDRPSAPPASDSAHSDTLKQSPHHKAAASPQHPAELQSAAG